MDEIIKATCSHCEKEFNYNKRFTRWKFGACSMKCLDALCEQRMEEIHQKEVEERKNYRSRGGCYTSDGGNAY